jgi:hypothetical protein
MSSREALTLKRRWKHLSGHIPGDTSKTRAGFLDGGHGTASRRAA